MRKAILITAFIAIALLMTFGVASAATYGKITVPTGLETYCNATSHVVALVAGNVTPVVNMTLCYNTTETNHVLITNTTLGPTANFSVTTWDVTGIADGTAYDVTLFINATPSSNCSSLWNASVSAATDITIDNNGPVLTYITATPGDAKEVGYKSTFGVTTDETVGSCTLYYNASTGSKQQVSLTNTSVTAFSYVFTAGQPPEATYTYAIVCADNTSCTNKAASTTRTVKIDDSRAASIAGAVAAEEAARRPAIGIVARIKALFCQWFNIWC